MLSYNLTITIAFPLRAIVGRKSSVKVARLRKKTNKKLTESEIGFFSYVKGKAKCLKLLFSA
jgi:hypothetical protein